MKCPSCGAQNYETELVCQQCGVLLALTPEEIERVERYRISANTEILCVMFADVSGFSGIANNSLSHSQRVLAVHMALSQAIIERDRVGEIVNTAGDGILAVFSNPATATERALELHAAVHLYHQGSITEGYLANALRTAKLPLHPNVDDEEYKIHIGLHLGLVTRGGRTSRDVFGHNVNVACRFCSLAGSGQTYVSTAVYDNARLILGGREDLEWQQWKDQEIRGLTESMDVFGVAQRPFNVITQPRGSKPVEEKKPPRLAGRSLLVPAITVAALLLIGGVAAYLGMHRPPPPPPDKPSEIVAAGRRADKLSPLVPVALELTPAGYTAVNVSVLPPTNAAGSATNVSLPVPGEAKSALDAAALENFDAAVMQRPEVEKIAFGETEQTQVGSIFAIRGKDAILLAVAVDHHAHEKAEMSLLLDGDCNEQLQSQSATPFLDVLLKVGLPDSPQKEATLYKLEKEQPGIPLRPRGMTARAFFTEKETIWLFRLPDTQFDQANQYANFVLRYQPEGADGIEYPPMGQGGLRRLAISP